ncbi:hypothetical protein EXN69_23030 [Rhizobium rhizogenes]|nr:hypothetical protein [Rhizobium rhizogenes]NTJ22637.1 hypothetical protein [Rhizobium rhizogenes]TQO80564.1 hypothetical protein FFE80_05530 [Rhizobium rhizogenes]TRB52523.1 hypothetical protein EXN69_23030 [Rhizobium rhizogenes]
MVTLKGGDKLAAALAEIAKKVSKASEVDVGFLENATYPDGTNVANVAAIQEFGAPKAGIPPRPFFRTMIEQKSPEWPEAVGNLLVSNGYDGAKTLGQTGAAIKGQLQQSIIDTFAPPLSDITLMLRKMRAEDPELVVSGKTVGEAARRVASGESVEGVSTKPLVDSGHLLNSIDYEVKS